MIATTEQLVETKLASLTIHEKVGLLFHPMVFVDVDTDLDAPSMDGPSFRELVQEHHVRHMCLAVTPHPRETARALDRIQALAAETSAAIPITFSTDPRHSFVENAGASHSATGVSQWPEPIGFGALDDPDAVREFASIVRDDYLAMGIRMALHPQVDLATEARWARQAQSFGAGAQLTSRLLTAFLEGLQGNTLGPGSVAATTKHFPGGGPQRDGLDPHFPYGREQVYPGGRFEDHLAPFRAAIAAGTAAIMPYYGMPVGLELGGEPVEQVGFAFNRRLITGLLRDELGFDGVVLSDFGLVTDQFFFGKPLPARAWGVEHLSPADRMLRLIDAGVDQFGGERRNDLVLQLLDEGRVSEQRIDESARRILTVTARLGLLDGTAETRDAQGIGAPEQIVLGHTTQSMAVTVLTNTVVDGTPILPLAAPLRVYSPTIPADALPQGLDAAGPDDADVAILRIHAPSERRDDFALEVGMEQGSLDLPAEFIDEVIGLAQRVPVVVAVTLSRPTVLTPIAGHTAALVGDFGASDAALLDALTGAVSPRGRLPFELPASMAAVEASQPDVASDTADPLFTEGWGLDIGASVATSIHP